MTGGPIDLRMDRSLALESGMEAPARLSPGVSMMVVNFPTKLFPLHLTGIERFLLDDDRPSHPMAFVIEMDFAGKIDVNAFHHAMVAALYRHPLLVARMGPAKNRSHCWLKPDGTLPRVDVADFDQPINLPEDGEWIDLAKEVGLRLWLRIAPDKTRVTFQFHHVCCDGIGAYRFIGDLLAYYSARTGGVDSVAIPNIDLKRLRGRADRCRFMSKNTATLNLITSSLKHCYQIMGRACAPLAINRAAQVDVPNPFPGLCSHTFTQRESNLLRDAAKELGLMLNDLLILELFQAVHFWNAEITGRAKNSNYRIMMPVDLRSTDDFETPAANVIGYTFLSRRGSDLDDRAALAKSIREETAGIKHNRLGERFNDMIAMGDHVRPLKKLALKIPRALCTAVLSNVGDPSRRFLAKFQRQSGCIVAGNLVLERISGYPPLRPKSRASYSIVTYRRELTISLKCDPHEFSKRDTDHMLSLFVAALRKHLPANLDSTSSKIETASKSEIAEISPVNSEPDLAAVV